MKAVHEVVDFVEDHQNFFQDRTRAWDYVLDFLNEIGYGEGEVMWLKGETAFVAVDHKAMTRVVALIEHKLTDQ